MLGAERSIASIRPPAIDRRRMFRKELKKQYPVLLMLVPAIVYYIVFQYAPLYGAQIAFRDFNFVKGITGSKWVGLAVFRDLLSRPSFVSVFLNTLIISSMKLVFGFPAPIIFALMLNEIRFNKYKRVVQTISYFPYFLSWVILSGIFVQLLSPTIGPSAAIMQMMGLKPIYWLGDPRYFRYVLVVTSIWKNVGWGSIVYLAAIAGVDPQLHEAAIMDGANRFKRMLHVTLPGIAPTVTIMFIFAIGGLVSDDFDQIYNMYNSGVMGVADVLATYTYRSGMEQFQFSIATAAGLLQNVISFFLILLTNYVSKRYSEYGIW